MRSPVKTNRPPPADLNQVVREVLVALRKRHGWSENRMAREIGVVQKTLNNFMAGANGMNLETLSGICQRLRLPPHHFFELHPAYARSEEEQKLGELLADVERQGNMSAAIQVLSAVVQASKSSP